MNPSSPAEPEFSQITTAPFPLPKTNKPRPHVCETCSRSFARREHLKRHERSHTKEKPFECPQCTRGFARRDLLLRHQQKLHQQGATSSKPGNGRRESVSSLPPNATGRVRKNSMTSSIGGAARIGTSSMRPRANTISHIDPIALNNLLASHNALLARGGEDHLGHSHYANLSGLNSPSTFDYRGMSTSIGDQRQHHGLAKLDTRLGLGLASGLQTASSQGCGPDASELEKFFDSSYSPITPNQLHHFKENASNLQSPFPSPSSNLFTGTTSIQENEFDWSTGLENFTISCAANEAGVNESLPSVISTTSQSWFSEVMLDGSRQPIPAAMGRHNPLSAHYDVNPATYSLDGMARLVPELTINTISWKELAEQAFHHP